MNLPSLRPFYIKVSFNKFQLNVVMNDTLIGGQGNSLGFLSSVMAYNAEFLLMWWQAMQLDTWSEVTVTVYNLGRYTVRDFY